MVPEMPVRRLSWLSADELDGWDRKHSLKFLERRGRLIVCQLCFDQQKGITALCNQKINLLLLLVPYTEK